MTTMKSSTLPAVLKEYLPEYEPRSSTASTKKKDEAPTQSEAPKEEEVKGQEEAKGQEQDDTPVTPRTPGMPGEEPGQGHHGGRRASRAGGRRASRAAGVDTIEEGNEDERPKPRKNTALQRERTMELLKKQERERYTRNFDNWQQVKNDEREDKTRHYKSKIALQHELIRQQDQKFLRQRQEEEEERIKQKELDRAARHAQEQALLEVCRQSLEQDRKRVAKRSASRQGKKSAKGTQKASETDTKDEATEIKPLTVRQVTMMSEMSSHSSLASGAFNMGMGTTQGGTLQEANEDGDEEEDDELREIEELPWHHQQLYKLYGSEADYFLHPKIEVQKTPRQISQRSRARPVYNGRTGARKLWNNLRTESRMRLLAEDSNISQELKSAYSAFFRQALQRHKKPVKRNFYAEEDVPDADRLLDQSIIYNTQDLRHKMELMYRSSQNNEDRAKVLLFNNPPPNLNNKEGAESVIRYMPSWIDDTSEASPAPSYKKWMQARPFPTIAKQSQGAEKASPLTEDPEPGWPPASPEVEDKEDWDFMLVKRQHKVRKPKYQFLTEEAATCEGQFSRRRRELLEAKHLPEAYSRDLPPKPQSGTQSAMAMISRGPVSRRNSSIGTGEQYVSVPRSQSEATHHYVSPWEPLSLHALVEYKHHVQALGEGNFAHGTTHMWSVMTP